MEPELKEIKAFVPTEIHPITGLTLSGGKCPCIFPEFKMIYVRVPGTGSSSFFLELGRRSKTEYVDVPTSGHVRDMELFNLLWIVPCAIIETHEDFMHSHIILYSNNYPKED